MASPLPQVQYLMAFQNAATDAPSSVTSVAAPGVLGAHNVWTDITQYVRGHTWARGRQHELDRFQAGTMSINVDNATGVFSPWNLSSPYAGFLLPLKMVQYRVTWNAVTYKRFTGYVLGWDVQWPDPLSSEATIVTADLFHLLNAVNMVKVGAAVAPYYPAVVMATTPAPSAYWRCNESKGSTLLADSSGGGFALGDPRTDLGGGSGINFSQINGPGSSVALGAAGPLTTEPSAGMVAVSDGTVNNDGAGGTAYGAFIGTQRSSAGLPAATSTVAVEAWFLCSTVPTAPASGLAAAFVGVSSMYLGVDSSGLLYGSLGGSTFLHSTGVSVCDGVWHHAALTMSGGVGSLYLDGVLRQSTGSGWSSSLQLNRAAIGIQEGTDTRPSFPSTFPSTTVAVAEVACYFTTIPASTTWLAHYRSGLGGLYASGSGARVSNALALALGSGVDTAISAGAAAVQQNNVNVMLTKLLAHLQLIEQTEQGALFMDGAGRVTFLGRQDLLTGAKQATTQATFGDTIATEIPFEPAPAMALDDTDIWNLVTVQSAGGVTQLQTDATSVAAYGSRTLALSGLLNTSDADSLYMAQWLVSRYKQPVFRVRSLNLSLLDFLGATAQVASVLGLDLLARVVLNRHGLPGTAFVQTALVEQMAETVSVNGWTLTLGLSPVDTVAYFILNDPVNGVLNTSALGY